MAGTLRFSATINGADQGGAYVVLPFDLEIEFGKKRPKVKATFDGEPYRGTATRMGGQDYLLLVKKEIRAKIGKDIGDTIAVTVEEDTEPRLVKIPLDLQQAFDCNPKAAATFDRLSYTHKKEYVGYINEAQKNTTRVARIAKTVELLTAQEKPNNK